MRLIIIFLAMLIVVPVFGQRRKRTDEESIVTYTEGITYSLPRTGLRLKITAVKEIFTPGPYSSYAEQLLGISDAGDKPSVKWVIEDIKIETFTEPDPDQVYKASGEGAFTVSLTPHGCLAGINANGGQYMLPVEVNSYIEEPSREDGFSFARFNDAPLYTKGDSTTGYRPVRLSNNTKAAEAAARIFECRLQKFNMAAGYMDEFHPDGDAYKVSLKELDEIEKGYLSLFTGRTTYSSESFSFNYIPETSAANGDVVFRFSEEKGIVPASDLSGKPVMVKVETDKDLIQKYSGMSESENPAAGESGVYYRMPAVADLDIIYELKTIASTRLVLPQFGKVAPVPEDLLFGDYSIKIHPETGAVESVNKM